MTHGAGGFSSGGGGGGGGFSGGGFSAASTTVYHGRRRRNSSSDGDGEGCCIICFAVAYLVGFFLCLFKMKPRTRVVLTWIYCILGAGLCWGLLMKKYGDREVPASPSDMREVTGMSPLFCYEVSVKSSKALLTYQFDKPPVIDMLKRDPYSYSANTDIARDDYEYWGFYLLKGSEVTAKSCPDRFGIYLYIIQGRKNLNAWLSNPYCDDCYTFTESLDSNDCHYQKYTINAHDSDDYFFAYVNRDPWVEPAIHLSIDFTLARTRYDLNDSQLFCFEEKDCVIPLTIDSTKHYVYDVPRDSPRDVDVTIKCESRIYMYIVLFAILPTILGAFVTVLILKCAKRKQNSEESRIRSNSQVFSISTSGPTLNVNNSYSNPIAQAPSPPKYVENPPSYEALYGAQ